MLGEKKTLPLWRRRRPNFLALERALAPGTARQTAAERTIIAQQIEQRRFEVAKGKVRPGP